MDSRLKQVLWIWCVFPGTLVPPVSIVSEFDKVRRHLSRLTNCVVASDLIEKLQEINLFGRSRSLIERITQSEKNDGHVAAARQLFNEVLAKRSGWLRVLVAYLCENQEDGLAQLICPHTYDDLLRSTMPASEEPSPAQEPRPHVEPRPHIEPRPAAEYRDHPPTPSAAPVINIQIQQADPSQSRPVGQCTGNSADSLDVSYVVMETEDGQVQDGQDLQDLYDPGHIEPSQRQDVDNQSGTHMSQSLVHPARREQIQRENSQPVQESKGIITSPVQVSGVTVDDIVGHHSNNPREQESVAASTQPLSLQQHQTAFFYTSDSGRNRNNTVFSSANPNVQCTSTQDGNVLASRGVSTSVGQTTATEYQAPQPSTVPTQGNVVVNPAAYTQHPTDQQMGGRPLLGRFTGTDANLSQTSQRSNGPIQVMDEDEDHPPRNLNLSEFDEAPDNVRVIQGRVDEQRQEAETSPKQRMMQQEEQERGLPSELQRRIKRNEVRPVVSLESTPLNSSQGSNIAVVRPTSTTPNLPNFDSLLPSSGSSSDARLHEDGAGNEAAEAQGDIQEQDDHPDRRSWIHRGLDYVGDLWDSLNM